MIRSRDDCVLEMVVDGSHLMEWMPLWRQPLLRAEYGSVSSVVFDEPFCKRAGPDIHGIPLAKIAGWRYGATQPSNILRNPNLRGQYFSLARHAILRWKV
jgi:hypothetical protein